MFYNIAKNLPVWHFAFYFTYKSFESYLLLGMFFNLISYLILQAKFCATVKPLTGHFFWKIGAYYSTVKTRFYGSRFYV